jgi:hypothetical protein
MGPAMLLSAILVVAGALPPQSRPIIKGTVIDAKTGAPIPDVLVALAEPALATRTDAAGRFAFPAVPQGTYTLTVSTIGYIFVRRQIQAAANTTIDLTIPLAEGTGTYQENVTVTPEPGRPRAIGVSSQIDLGSAGLADLRGVAADDPMRAIQALPGVATGDDFQAEFSVRGSSFRHVGVVMDGTPTQLLLHAIRGVNETGSVAMINTDILSQASLLAGPHGRRHGDWLGATLEFEVREGSRDRLGARAAVSGTSASAVFEGPIGPGKRGSWLVSVRRSYLDWLVRKIEPTVDSTIGFTDAQSKVVFDLTSRQQLQFLAIVGDATYREEEASLTNGLLRANSRSALGSLSWRYLLPRVVWSQQVSLVASEFVNRGRVGQRLAEGDTQLGIWRTEAVIPLPRGWLVETGVRYETQSADETLRVFQSNGLGGVRVRFSRTLSNDTTTTVGWGQASWRNARSGVAAGVRVVDQSASATRPALPWLLAEHTFGTTTVRAGAGRSAQFLDALAVSIAPDDQGPETATAYDLSVEQPLGLGFRVQATAFHRDERDVLRRAGEDRVDPVTGLRVPEGTFPLISPTLEGTSRGVDVVLMRRSPSGLSGWIGYSWAHTHYRDRLTGESFDGDRDQRHTLNVFAQQRLSYRMTVSGKLRMGSNVPLVGYFEGTTDALRLSTSRNQVRLPTYARLDVRANRTFTFQRTRLTLFVEVMNLLGRDNLRQTDGSIRANLEATGQVDRLLPRVPSAGFLFEF